MKKSKQTRKKLNNSVLDNNKFEELLINALDNKNLTFLEKFLKETPSAANNYISQGNSKFSPLFMSVCCNHKKVIKILLEANADINMPLKPEDKNDTGTIVDFIIDRNKIEMLEFLLKNTNQKYNIDFILFKNMVLNDIEKGNIIKTLKTYWTKIHLINYSVPVEAKEFDNFIWSIKNGQKILEGEKLICNFLNSGNYLDNKQSETIYSTIHKLNEYNRLDRLNYGKNNNPIFLKAANLKKWDALEVMLKALNSIKLEDKTKNLSELVIMSSESVEGLLEAFVKNYGINASDKTNCNILHYAVVEGKLDMVKKVVHKNNFIQEALDLAKDLKNNEICDYLTKYQKVQEQLNSKELNKINNQTLPNGDEKFKILPEKVKQKTNGNEKNQILRDLYEQNKDNYVMSPKLLETLNNNNIPVNDYKEFVWNEKKEDSNNFSNSEKVLQVHSWIIGGHKYSTDKNKIYYHEYKGKGYYLTLDENLYLEKIYQDKALTALEKGFSKTMHDDSGIKLFDGVMEIKVFTKKQVFSKIGYVNPKNQILVIFNNIATHEDIAIKALMYKQLPTTPDESITHSGYQDEVITLGDNENKDYNDNN